MAPEPTHSDNRHPTAQVRTALGRRVDTWRRDPAADVIAGLVLAGLLIPQGMAYAQLAGLSPVNGLYTTIAALVAYALAGPSRTLILGPDSSLAPLIAAAVVPLAAGDAARSAELAAVLAIMVGLVCLAAGAVGLGSITELLSRPVQVGFLNGLAIVVIANQLPRLLGVEVTASSTLARLGEVASEAVEVGLTLTGVIGLLTIALVAGARRWRPSFPAALAAMVVGGLVSHFGGLADRSVGVIGPIPAGIPAPSIPWTAIDDVVALMPAALAISILAFADTNAISRAMSSARRPSGQPVSAADPNAEAKGLGVANMAAGLLAGFPISGSSSRTSVALSMGARSQLAGVVGAAAVALVLLIGDRMIRPVPDAVLAAVVIVAMSTLVDASTPSWLAKVRPSEFWLSMAATTGVAFVGVLEGIAIAVLLSIGVFVQRSWRPHDAVLGRVDGEKGYHDIGRHPDAAQIPGLMIFRFDAPLFFANAEHFRRRLDEAIAERSVDAEDGVRWVLIAAEPITDIDTTGAETLSTLLVDLSADGVELAFAELKGPVKDRLRAYDIYDEIGHRRIFATLGTAISAYLAEHEVPWTDWTDRPPA